MQVLVSSRFAWSSSLWYVKRKKLIRGFFLLHRIAWYRGGETKRGIEERCYMWQLENCLDRPREKEGILFCITARFRRLQNIEWKRDQMLLPEESIWISSSPRLSRVPTSKTRSWVLPNIELMARIKRAEDRYTVKPTSVAWFVWRRLCRRLHVPHFIGRPVLMYHWRGRHHHHHHHIRDNCRFYLKSCAWSMCVCVNEWLVVGEFQKQRGEWLASRPGWFTTTERDRVPCWLKASGWDQKFGKREKSHRIGNRTLDLPGPSASTTHTLR